MPDGHQLSQELHATLDRIEAADPPITGPDCNRATIERLRAALEALHQRAVSSEAGADELREIAAIIREREQADAGRLRSEGQAASPEALALARGRSDLYRELHDKLLTLAAERDGESPKIMRARPVAGDIDYAELSREHIARYPKIRGALAK